MKKLLWLLFSGLIPISLLLLALYIFDPFQLYHKPYWRKTFFSQDMHYQAAGIINNYDFDSAILGSSIMVNTSSIEASKKLGGNWVNLSAGGSGVFERMDILNFLLSQKKIKTIIFTLEPGWLNENQTTANQYRYLYDQSKINDFKTYLDEIFIFCFFIQKICLPKGQETLDRPANWINEPSTKGRLGGFQSWIDNKNRPDINHIFNQIKNFQETKYDTQTQKIPSALIDSIKQNLSTEFIFIIPPFARLGYKINFISIKQALQELLSQNLPNLKIYGFDDTSIPDDLSHYVDLAHYDESINSFMLDAIKDDTHRITLENIDSYFQTMQEKIDSYDIESLRQKILSL